MTTLERYVDASGESCLVDWNGAGWDLISINPAYIFAGYLLSQAQRGGGGMRFKNINIPKGATITAASLIGTAFERAYSSTETVITGNKEPNPAPFTTLSDYQARRGTIVGGPNNSRITSAQVDWSFAAGEWGAAITPRVTRVSSPDISAIIQELIDQPEWVPGNSMVIFWDDHAGNTTSRQDFQSMKQIISYGQGDLAHNPILHIEYTGGELPPTNIYIVPVIVHPVSQPCGLRMILTTDIDGTLVQAQTPDVFFTSTGSQQNIVLTLSTRPIPGNYYVFVLGYMNGVLVAISAQGMVGIF